MFSALLNVCVEEVLVYDGDNCVLRIQRCPRTQPWWEHSHHRNWKMLCIGAWFTVVRIKKVQGEMLMMQLKLKTVRFVTITL